MSVYNYKSIDDLLSGRVRLAAMAFLAIARTADFNELLAATEATKGNLSAQIRKLEEAGYVTVKKGYRGRRPHMSVTLAEKGRRAFQDYFEHLRQLAPAAPRNQ